MKYKAPAYNPHVLSIRASSTNAWMNRTCITMYIVSVVAWGAVKWILSFLTLSACVDAFCWSSKCFRILQGCVLTFKREKKTQHFSQNLSIYCMRACLFVSVGILKCKCKMLIMYSVLLGCRGHCAHFPLWKLKCSTSNGWGARTVTQGMRGRGAHRIASVWVMHLTVRWGFGKIPYVCWFCKELCF